AQGHIRRLRYRQVRFGQLLLVQMLLGALLSALLGLMVACALRFLAPGLNIGAALLSSALLGLVLTPIFLVFSGLPGPPAGAATRAMLGCLALCFLMLFVGGGFYPSFLMESSLRLGNPAWLANLLAIWSLGGNLEPMQLLGFVVPVALAAGICYFEWRKVS
ncbi:MAG: hypothetical protein LBR39_06675, partial [Coriobacteriales bacterium]|nr:hypothetical protein [Coriobacteriales bacterium]